MVVGTALMAALRACADDLLPDLRLQGLPMAFHASFGAGDEPVTSYGQLKQRDQERYARLAVALFDQGVWVARRGIWYVSAAHAEADVTETVDRVEAAFMLGLQPRGPGLAPHPGAQLVGKTVEAPLRPPRRDPRLRAYR